MSEKQKKSVSGCHLLLDTQNYMLKKKNRKIKKNLTQWDPGYGSVIQAIAQ